jgi:hypothetical protein
MAAAAMQNILALVKTGMGLSRKFTQPRSWARQSQRRRRCSQTTRSL